MILLGKSKSKTLKKGKLKRNNLYFSTTENSQLYRDVVRTNQTSKTEIFVKIVNDLESLRTCFFYCTYFDMYKL